MGFTIDVDTGGTFTDGFFTRDGQTLQVKVGTTPHDLTVCFINCIKEAARRFDIPVRDMLRQTEAVRFSSTIGSNTLIQRSGPKLGLIVTKGFETNLYGAKGTRSPALDFIIPENMVVGIDEEIDSQGKQIREPSETEVRAAVHSLLENGARAIVVSLRRASLNAANEQKVKQLIKEDYPRHYVGAVSVLIATDISGTHDDVAVTNIALLNAYFHPDLVRFLYKADDDLRNLGYSKPLLITHSDGGVARVSKTTAIKTYGSGPAAGLCGTAFMSKLYKLPYVVSIDIGGTSTDIGITIEGNYIYDREPVIENIPIKLPIIDVQSIGGGGGSVAKPRGKGIKLGPESVGAMPGPACYDLGGTESTPTDACVVLGYIDPDYFLGGKKKLNAAKAREAIDRNIARKLGISVEEAACLIIKELETLGVNAITKFISSRGYENKEFILFSFGGGGGLYCCGIADQAGTRRIYNFPFSPVFSAFGSSTMDIQHTYESPAAKILSLTSSPAHLKEFNSVVRRLQAEAFRDMRGEGFSKEKVSFSLEMEVASGDLSTVIEHPHLLLDQKAGVKSLLDDFAAKTGARVSELTVWLFRLRATSPIVHPMPPSYEIVQEDPAKALKGRRNVYWNDGFTETNIYEQKLMDCGNVVYGPAIIESEGTTIRIPMGKKYAVDRFLNGVIERT